MRAPYLKQTNSAEMLSKHVLVGSLRQITNINGAIQRIALARILARHCASKPLQFRDGNINYAKTRPLRHDFTGINSRDATISEFQNEKGDS